MGSKIIIILLIFIILAFSGCCCSLNLKSPVNDIIHYNGYQFVKKHKIVGSIDGALSGYQMKFNVYRGDGVDSGQYVYLNGDSQSWPYDIRFTDSDSKPYPYWIESFDDNNAVIWVKLDRIPANPATMTITLYYGKPGDTGASNGKDTFMFFDDFNDGDIKGWDTPVDSSVTESDGVLYVSPTTASPGYIPSGYTFTNGVIESRAKVVRSSGCDHIFILARKNVQGGFRGYNLDDACIYNFVNAFIAGPKRYEDLESATGQWHRMKLTANDEYVSFYVRNEVTGNEVTLSGITNNLSPGLVSLGTHKATVPNDETICFDWVFVRKYTNSEPVHGSWNNG